MIIYKKILVMVGKLTQFMLGIQNDIPCHRSMKACNECPFS